MQDYKSIAFNVVLSSPKWSLIEDDIALSDYILKTQSYDLTLEEVAQVRVYLDKE